LSFVETANTVSWISRSNSFYSSKASIVLICFAILLSLSGLLDLSFWFWLYFCKLYRLGAGIPGLVTGCFWNISWLLDRFAGFLGCVFLVDRFTDIFVGSVGPSGICKKITILKLFSFSQRGSSTIGIGSCLGFLIGLYTVRILGVLCRYFFRKFRSTVLLFVFFSKSTILVLTVVCKSGI
jgi:hypothetical protein